MLDLKIFNKNIDNFKKHLLNHKRIGYFKRHMSTFGSHLSLNKLTNLILNEIEMRLRIASPISLPVYLKVEPTPLCQLRCMGCYQKEPNFKHDLLKLNNGNMFLSLEDLKKIIDPLKDTLIGVSLSLYGEPLLNKNIVLLIEYLHSNNIAVSFPTNLSIKFSYNQIAELVKSGLDCIEVSLDGASQESYNKYRIGGNFELVLKNVKLLSEAKKHLNLKNPQIVWKYIVFDHNKHETGMINTIYKKLGFDRYEIEYDNYSDIETKIKIDNSKNLVKAKKPCYWLWNTTIIRWDGNVKPCCTTSDDFTLGNAIKYNIKEIWRSDEYRVLREGFLKRQYGQYMHPICKKCTGLSNNTYLIN